MNHTLARSLVSLASPFLFVMYIWNNVKSLSFSEQFHAIAWLEESDLD